MSYVSLVCSKETRHIHLAVAEAAIVGGVLIGTLINGPIIDNWGLDILVYTNVAFCLIAVLIVIFFIPELYKQFARELTWREILWPDQILDTFRCLLKRRPSNGRLLLNLSMVVYTCILITVVGFSTVLYLYLVKELGLSTTQHSIYSAVLSGVKVVLGPSILLLVRRFNVNKFDTAIYMIALAILGYVLLSMGGSIYLLWIGGILLCGQITIVAVLRGLQASIVDEDEMGKLFAWDAFIQIISASLISILYNSLYGWCVSFWPALVFAFSGLLLLFGLVIMCILVIRMNAVNRSEESTDYTTIHQINE